MNMEKEIHLTVQHMANEMFWPHRDPCQLEENTCKHTSNDKDFCEVKMSHLLYKKCQKEGKRATPIRLTSVDITGAERPR